VTSNCSYMSIDMVKMKNLSDCFGVSVVAARYGGVQ
jgi:hypothetical protein